MAPDPRAKVAWHFRGMHPGGSTPLSVTAGSARIVLSRDRHLDRFAQALPGACVAARELDRAQAGNKKRLTENRTGVGCNR